MHGKSGGITSFIPSPSLSEQPSEKYPNWWTDDPDPELAEGSHIGAKTGSYPYCHSEWSRRIILCNVIKWANYIVYSNELFTNKYILI